MAKELLSETGYIRRASASIFGEKDSYIIDIDYSPEEVAIRQSKGIVSQNPWDIFDQELIRGLAKLPYTGGKTYPHSLAWTPGIRFHKFPEANPEKDYLGPDLKEKDTYIMPNYTNLLYLKP
jgi:hypothetical protein